MRKCLSLTHVDVLVSSKYAAILGCDELALLLTEIAHHMLLPLRVGLG